MNNIAVINLVTVKYESGADISEVIGKACIVQSEVAGTIKNEKQHTDRTVYEIILKGGRIIETDQAGMIKILNAIK